MKRFAILAAMGALTACATVELAPLTWETTTQGQEDYAARVAATAATGGNQTVVHVALASGTPGATIPWHVHRGTCGNDRGIVGPSDAYPPLRPGTDGRATGSVTIDAPLAADESYFVKAHASPQNLQTTIACAPLRRR